MGCYEEYTRNVLKMFKELEEHERLGLEWKPCAFYNPDGDLIEWYNERCSYYGDRINEIITLYRAEDDDRIVGGCIKNIDHIMNPESTIKPRMD